MVHLGWWSHETGTNPELDRVLFDLKDATVKFWSTLHEATYRVTDGQILNRVLGMKVVRLTTVGRSTGIRRETMLTAPIYEGDLVVLVASNGGDARDPQWFKNVLACPEVTVTTEASSREMRARVATGPERSHLWRRIRTVTVTYDLYQRRTARQIPLVVLESVESPAS